jgi:cell division protease FtsH
MMFDKMMHEKRYSEETAKLIDDEVEALITEAAKRAELVIKANKKELGALKKELLEKETVEAEQVIEILKNTTMPKSAALY